MSKIIFILGGARSGKSSYAIALAKRFKKVCYIATGEAKDNEMRQRIRQHKIARPVYWQVFEEPKDIAGKIKLIGKSSDCIIIDCLTLWVSNLVLSAKRLPAIEKKINQVLFYLKKNKSRAIIVSNEVGLGVVPQTKLGRNFRDIAGRINQIVAKNADEVIFMASGLPLKLKG